jgi:hypothetical protein
LTFPAKLVGALGQTARLDPEHSKQSLVTNGDTRSRHPALQKK